MAYGGLPLDWIAALAVAIALGYIYLVWNYDYWRKRGIPYEKPQIFFGNVKDVALVKKNFGTLMHEIYNMQEGHPYVGLFQFRTPALLLRDLDVIKTVLIKEFPSFDKNAFTIDPGLDPLFSRNPFFTTGERWRSIRSLLSTSFTAGKLKPLFPLMEKAAKDLDNYLQKHGSDDLEAKELCCKYTTDVVASCAFGIEAGCFQDTESEFRTMNKKMFNTDFLTNFRIHSQKMFPEIRTLIRIRFMPTPVADFYRRIVKDVMACREHNKVIRNDFLQLLMQNKEKTQANFEQENCKGNRSGYTDEDIIGHAVTFIVEGFETSSITMSFIFYELAMNPNVQKKLREELQDAMEQNGGTLSYEVVNSLPYLNMVFTESLRMHPPVLVLEKLCSKRCEIPKESGGTLLVEPGTLILIPVHAIQYDPKYYPEPERFDPERFSDERKDSIPKLAYLPFGDGPRICIGIRFAQAQVKTGVAHVVLNYYIRPSYRTPKTIAQDVNYFLAASKDGIWLNFVRRY